ncbi:MAG: M23 family metallopeptidase [Patescibacteria group bacterium]
MSKFPIFIKFFNPKIFGELKSFFKFLKIYLRSRFYRLFSKFESVKSLFVDLLYKKRGRYARPFLHMGAVSLGFLVIALGPLILQSKDREDVGQSQELSKQGDFYDNSSFYTIQAEEVRQFRGGEIIIHVVQEGETLSSIASRYGLETSTILWENNLTEKSKIKPGLELKILPIDGVIHKVKRGETIYSIGKKYSLDENQVQGIIDYPFNEFRNDENFELASGQALVVPGGVRKDTTVKPSVSIASVLTPDAGTVTASGNFIWPASGRITQGYRFYHRAIDIANKSGGPILAADSGTVTTASWSGGGYGNHVVIDHGNGFYTLYAHLRVIQVKQGQRVNRGDLLGQMGNTGRSTGTHLHFEIRRGGALDNPLNYLR